MRRHRSVLALLMLALLSLGPTWPRDDTGVPAPVNVFLGSAGDPTQVSGTDPLPVNTEAATTSTTDPTGFGKQMFAGSGMTPPARGANNPGDGAVLFISGQTVYGFLCGTGASSPDTYLSTNGGRTYALISAGSGATCTFARKALRTSTGFFLGTSTIGGQGLLFSGNGLGAWSVITLPVNFVGPGVGAYDIALQGSTMIVAKDAANTTQQQPEFCRSTNSGTSFSTCIDASGTVGTFQFLSDILTSPAATVFLAVGNAAGVGRILRSTDDGVTFPIVFTNTSGNLRGVECISSSICLTMGDGSAGDEVIFRSIDAGVTWSQVFSVPATFVLNWEDSILNFGSGVVSMIGNLAGNNKMVFRSTDFGLTWETESTLTNPVAPTSTDIGSTDTLLGRAAIVGEGVSATAGFMGYMPIIGAGNRIIQGRSGFEWEINSSGHGLVAQGSPALQSNRWPVFLSDGTNPLGTVTNPIFQSPDRVETLNSSQPSCGVTATNISAALGAKRDVLVVNRGAANVFVGPTGVTTATGLQLSVGESVAFDDFDGAVFCIAGTAQTVHVLEVRN